MKDVIIQCLWDRQIKEKKMTILIMPLLVIGILIVRYILLLIGILWIANIQVFLVILGVIFFGSLLFNVVFWKSDGSAYDTWRKERFNESLWREIYGLVEDVDGLDVDYIMTKKYIIDPATINFIRVKDIRLIEKTKTQVVLEGDKREFTLYGLDADELEERVRQVWQK